jgi:hypothetical protein
MTEERFYESSYLRWPTPVWQIAALLGGRWLDRRDRWHPHGLSEAALVPTVPPVGVIFTNSLLLAFVAWIVVMIVLGVWLHYGLSQIAVPAAVNAIITSFLTVWLNLIIQLPWLAPLLGILVGLILCRFCRPVSKARRGSPMANCPPKPPAGSTGASTDSTLTTILAALGVLGTIGSIVGIVVKATDLSTISILGIAGKGVGSIGLSAVVAAAAVMITSFVLWYNRQRRNPASVTKNRDSVAELEDLIQVMRHIYDCDPRGADIADDLEQPCDLSGG